MSVSIDWPREARYPLTAAMEVAWFTPWYLALLPETARLSPVRSAVGLLVLVLIPLYLTRLMDYLRLRLRVQRAIMIVVLLLTALLAARLVLYAGQRYDSLSWLQESVTDSLDVYRLIPDWAVIFVATLFLWWRGISIGQRGPSVGVIRIGFFTGLILFILFVLAVTIVTGEEPAPFIPPFFFFSLMAMGASRAEQIHVSRGAMQADFGPVWMLYLTSASTSIVVLGAVVAMLLTGSGPEELQAWLGPLTAAVGFLLIVLALPIVLILGAALALAQLVGQLIGRILQGSGFETGQNPFQALLEFLDNLFRSPGTTEGEAPTVLGPIKLVMMLVGLALLTLLVSLLLRRLGRRDGDRGREWRESIFEPKVLFKNIRQILQAGQRRLAEAADLGRVGVRRLFAALTIRRIYAQMTRLAAEVGHPRAPSQTPYEYQTTLDQVVPGCGADVQQITEAYVGIHYGELPESREELAQVRASWHRVQAALQAKRP